MKTVYIILIFGMIALAFNEQTKTQPNIWIQVAGVLAFFYGMMKIMSKTPSNTKDKEEKDV